MKIYELLSSEDKWTTQTLARDNNLRPVNEDSPLAVRWCLIGAVYKCYDDDEFVNVIKKLDLATNYNIGKWNDSHTFEEIITLVRELDI